MIDTIDTIDTCEFKMAPKSGVDPLLTIDTIDTGIDTSPAFEAVDLTAAGWLEASTPMAIGE